MIKQELVLNVLIVLTITYIYIYIYKTYNDMIR